MPRHKHEWQYAGNDKRHISDPGYTSAAAAALQYYYSAKILETIRPKSNKFVCSCGDVMWKQEPQLADLLEKE